MKKTSPFLIALFLFSRFALINAAETVTEEKTDALEQNVDIAKISEAFGHLIGKNLENIGVEFDIARVIKGLQDASSGKNAPMTEAECVQAIAAVQEQLFKEQCFSNLSKAENFLAENEKKENVVSLEKGKVQYKIELAGTGSPVESHFSPMIRYTGKFLDGSVFGESKEEEMLSLDEVIPGLKTGLVGMKEGEKRTIYIHPEMAYGTNGYLPPNSLLTFEIEVVKANSPQAETHDSITQDGQQSSGSEIADNETTLR